MFVSPGLCLVDRLHLIAVLLWTLGNAVSQENTLFLLLGHGVWVQNTHPTSRYHSSELVRVNARM